MEAEEKKTYSYRKPDAKPDRFWVPAVLFMAVSLGVLMGYFINQITRDNEVVFSSYSGESSVLDEVMSLIDAKYVDTLSLDRLREKAIERLLAGLDPHSTYIPPRELTEVTQDMEGEFEGVGIEFHLLNDTIYVVSAISGGPSEMAGIRAGDRIVKVNDTTVAGTGITNDGVLKKLRGRKGSAVRLGIKRNGLKDLVSFTILRDKIPIYSIDAAYLADPQTAYIKINRFSATTVDEFKEKLRPLVEKGAKNLVLDLRQNPGGFLNAAIDILDELIAGKKLLLYTEGKAYSRQEYLSARPGMMEDGNITVIVDQGSASASEIIAGAVQDLDRGWVVGRTTFGKGLVGEQYELMDGGALRLTVARYYTPSGRCIQKPYQNGAEAYHNEVYDRFTQGRLTQEDTLKADTLIYRTSRLKRIVKGGGGIRPDVFVPLDTSLLASGLLQIRAEVPEFTYAWASDHPEYTKDYSSYGDFAARFQVPADMKQAFADHLARKKVSGTITVAATRELESLMCAYIARNCWKLDGFYYVLNQSDAEYKAALQQISKPVQ
jgi:carboxyl-terminal processing protease